MSPLLPAAPDAASFDALARDDPRIVAGVAEIARRHGIADGPATCFPTGSLPVYAVGAAHVVKLYPPCFAHEEPIERSALEAVDGRLGIPTPGLEASGELEGWRYLVMSRLAGESLATAWPRIPSADRERLMEVVGGALARLHSLTVHGLSVPRPNWGRFVREQSATAVERQRARGLESHWLAQIPAFLSSVALPLGPPSLLHTEVMREHLLVDERPEGFVLTGLFDFEPSMVGDADYEFASVGIFVTGGEGPLLRRLLLGYGRRESDLSEDLSRRFMAYALLHRYSHLPWYLRRIPPPLAARTLDDLARAWWPLERR